MFVANRRRIRRASALLAFCVPLFAVAAPAAPAPRASLDTTLGGTVIDHTITAGGREFYRHFAALWRELDTHERYQITVYEQPSARRGTLVWISFGDQRVFQANLPGSRSKVRELASQAGEPSYQNVVDAEARQLLFGERDLAPAEM